jgi:hypothetical protein
MKRRSFLKLTANAGALASLAGIQLLERLPKVSAAEATVEKSMVRFHPDIEPLVRLIEQTPRDHVIEEVAARIKKGASYKEVVAALFLAGVRNVQPRPVGFKFHAVLVVNSAHLASVASPDHERWLPILWAIDQFKSSQEADVREGDWTMGPPRESRLPAADKAREALIEAMDQWDEEGADAAITTMARSAGAHEIYDVLARYGARDFREIGHKEIFVANSFRALELVGWRHAEPVLRSLAYAILDRDGAKENPAKADFSADRPYRQNLETVKEIKPGWLNGKRNEEAAAEMLASLRQGNSKDTSATAVELLNRGTSPDSIFDACFLAASELMMRAPGILSLHATTFTNALHYSFQHCKDDETRKLLLLQNAAFIPLFRGNNKSGADLATIDPIDLKVQGTEAVDEIFRELGKNKLESARKILGYLAKEENPTELMRRARQLIFLKGTNAHDYKYSAALLEDFFHMPPQYRNRCLASGAFYLKGESDSDNPLTKRLKAAV